MKTARGTLLGELPLVCPSCRRQAGGGRLVTQHKLSLSSARRVSGGHILEGALSCEEGCGRRYPIRKGVPCITKKPFSPPRGSVASGALPAYLHAHYGEFEGGLRGAGPGWLGDNSGFWSALRGALPKNGAHAAAIDLGCGVGRLTFELAKRSRVAVGIDLDFEALALAASFAREGRVEYRVWERELSSRPARNSYRPPGNAVFIMADALDPPFPAGYFGVAAAANLLDSIARPARLLRRMDSLLAPSGSMVLTSPFSWKEHVTQRSEWLESRTLDGPSTLKGIFCGRLRPGLGLRYRVEREIPAVRWSLRDHARHENAFLAQILRARKLLGPARDRQ